MRLLWVGAEAEVIPLSLVALVVLPGVGHSLYLLALLAQGVPVMLSVVILATVTLLQVVGEIAVATTVLVAVVVEEQYLLVLLV
jgi:hypothetical protein